MICIQRNIKTILSCFYVFIIFLYIKTNTNHIHGLTCVSFKVGFRDTPMRSMLIKLEPSPNQGIKILITPIVVTLV